MNKKILIILFLLSVTGVLFAAKQVWKPLKEDGLHDPQSPAIDILQQPAEALLQLPPDTTGNMVSWVQALRKNYIEPRTNLYPETKVNLRDTDIIMGRTGEMPMVLFPHKPHTEWLDCKNCHNAIFRKKVGSNPVNMFAILNGEYCGRCHGAVAFPLTECLRCHSVSRNKFKGKPGLQPKKSVSNTAGK